MFGLGVQELIVILLICVLLFGASRLPQIGKGLGEAIQNFKTGLKGAESVRESIEKSVTEDPGKDK